VTECLDKDKQALVRTALEQGTIQLGDRMTAVPLRVGSSLIGIVYLDREVQEERDVELLSVFANQAAVAIQNSQLYEMATLDPLTGVYVRRFFDQLLIRELVSTFRTQKPLAVLFMDLDNLKKINDTAGHPAGDQALAATGNVLRQAIRSADVAGRYGGDEFAVILPQADSEGAANVAQRIVDLMSTTRIAHKTGEFCLSASIGLGLIQPHMFAPSDIPRPIPLSYYQDIAKALVQRTDEALYAIKKSGGGRFKHTEPLAWPPIPLPVAS
jgi:diguanylate cyclase (GGDEF)-like protein